MTITTIVRSIDITLDGATLAHALPFKWLNDAWITATVDDVELSNGADFTLSGTGEPSGTITLASAGTAGQTLRVVRTVPLTQLTRFRNRGSYIADDIEDAMDTITMIAQQLVGGSLIPSGLDASLYQLPEPDADKLIGWNSTGTGLVNVDRTQIVLDGGGGGGGGTAFDINALTELAETPANPDFLPAYDVSASSAKKVTYERVFGALLGDARFTIAANQSLSASTEATVQFAVEGHNHLQRCTYNSGTYTLTATESCRIEVNAKIVVLSQSAGAYAYLSIQKGTTDVDADEDKVEADSTSRDLYLRVSSIINLQANETIRVRAFSSAAKNISATTKHSSITFKELG